MEGRDNVRRRAFGYLEKTLLALFRRSPLLCARGRNVSTENFTSFFDFVRFAGRKHRGNYGEKRKVSGWKFRCRIDRFVCQRSSRQVSVTKDLLKSLFLPSSFYLWFFWTLMETSFCLRPTAIRSFCLLHYRFRFKWNGLNEF